MAQKTDQMWDYYNMLIANWNNHNVKNIVKNNMHIIDDMYNSYDSPDIMLHIREFSDIVSDIVWQQGSSWEAAEEMKNFSREVMTYYANIKMIDLEDETDDEKE